MTIQEAKEILKKEISSSTETVEEREDGTKLVTRGFNINYEKEVEERREAEILLEELEAYDSELSNYVNSIVMKG